MPRQGKIRDRRAKRRNHRAALKAAQQTIIDDEALRQEAESMRFDDDDDDLNDEFEDPFHPDDIANEWDVYEPDIYYPEHYDY
jgi:hypothetical protein